MTHGFMHSGSFKPACLCCLIIGLVSLQEMAFRASRPPNMTLIPWSEFFTDAPCSKNNIASEQPAILNQYYAS